MLLGVIILRIKDFPSFSIFSLLHFADRYFTLRRLSSSLVHPPFLSTAFTIPPSFLSFILRVLIIFATFPLLNFALPLVPNHRILLANSSPRLPSPPLRLSSSFYLTTLPLFPFFFLLFSHSLLFAFLYHKNGFSFH